MIMPGIVCCDRAMGGLKSRMKRSDHAGNVEERSEDVRVIVNELMQVSPVRP